MSYGNVNDLIGPAARMMVEKASILLQRSNTKKEAESFIRVVRTAPTAKTDLTDPNIGQKSYCVGLLLKMTEDKAQGFYDAEIEDLAEYFFDYLPSLSRASRRLLEELVVGVLQGLKGSGDV